MTSSKAKIAIIEDDLTLAQMYRTKFQSEGYQVDVAGDGSSGLILVDKFKPDVIMLDIMMPNMSGIEFLQNLKKPRPKVLVLTNLDTKDLVESTRAMGADDYLVKASSTPTQVVERVEKILQQPAPEHDPDLPGASTE